LEEILKIFNKTFYQ